MNKNTLVLLLVTLVAFSLSGFLFYQGLKDEIRELNLLSFVRPPVVSPTPEQVLGEQKNDQATNSANLTEERAKVLKVVDGDTIEVYYNSQAYKLRYIGVDTPETVDPRRPVQCFGKEASDENKRLLEGKVVILEKDISETDKFGRLLRYVYLPLDDGVTLFINDYLVRQGFAKSSTYPPDVKHQERLLEAQKEARDNNRGLWGKCM